jgi:Dolichyl-phosphate-mannose-protein mannosyltransferase
MSSAIPEKVKRMFRKLTKEDKLLLSFAVVAVLVEVIPNLFGGYGYFIDEWYYIACAKRLAFGYVDQPPLALLLLRGMIALFGESISSIRFLPALAGGVTVFFTGKMARELGGGMFAQGVACLALIASPAFLIFFGFFSVNAFEYLFWTLCFYFLVRLFKDGDPRYWIYFGIAFGLGLETKHTIVLLGFAVAAGLLLTDRRRDFTKKEIWIAFAIAALLFLPNLIWQITNAWPSLEFYRNATIYKNIPTPPLKGILNQILLQGPVSLLVWLPGLFSLLMLKRWKSFLPLGWTFVALFLIIIASASSRPDRIAPAYTVTFAGGAAAIELLISKRKTYFLKPVAAGLILIGGFAMAPIGLPVLSPKALADYSAMLGVVPKLERGKSSPLPQWFADRFDWDVFVKKIVDIYDSLPPEDKKRAVIFAPDYGHAGALEFYAKTFGLPRVICNHNNYYLWSAGHANADVLIAIGANPRDLEAVYGKVDSVGVIPGTYAMSWRINMPVYVARDPKVPLNDVWPKVKHFE